MKISWHKPDAYAFNWTSDITGAITLVASDKCSAWQHHESSRCSGAGCPATQSKA
jgi:hypothetical protein